MIGVKLVKFCIASSKNMILQLRHHVVLVCFVSFLCNGILKSYAEAYDNEEILSGNINSNEDFGLCPTKNSKFPTYLPHPLDCSKFYICDSGSPHLKHCHPGLHFNTKINACDYPRNANCSTGDLVKPKGKIIDDEEDSSLCPSKNSKFPTYLPHPSDCNKFYICDSGTPHLKQCFPGLHFNPKINACDFSENVKCNTGDLEKPKGKLVDDEDSDDLCPANNSDFPVYLPHPSDCNKFYICDRGSPHLKDCQLGLHFNSKINACDFPENANCKTGDDVKIPNGKIIDDEDDSSLCPAKNSKFPTYLPHPSDCNKFYICDSGTPHLKQCHPGLHFNPKINACDFPENAKCNAGAMRSSPGIPSPYCPSRNGKTPIFFRDSTNCSVYYMCGNGLAYQFACPARLHFNLRKRICDYENAAGCVTS